MSEVGNLLGTHHIKVHPVVVLSILDHFNRRNSDQQRVIGTLLGVVSEGGDVDVRNSFPVPHSENEKDGVSVDMEFHRTMFELHQRVNPKETIVGWYATGNVVTYASSLIHEFYGREIRSTLTKELPNPIHLTVDSEFTNDKLSVRAYTSTIVGMPTADGPPGFMFYPLPCELKVADSERMGMDLIVKAKDSSVHTASLVTDLENLEQSVIKVRDLLDSVQTYVDDVLKGKISADSKVGRHLMTMLSSAPKMDKAQFEQLFNNNLQDLLMVVYLANLTRTQLSIATRLQQLL